MLLHQFVRLMLEYWQSETGVLAIDKFWQN